MPEKKNTPHELRVYKIVILGDGGVGKSAVTLQFVSHSFTDYHDPTIEDSYQQQAVIDGDAALLDILDTAGQVEFTAMRDQYMRCGEGFIICYSVTDRHSFQEASEYRKLIQRVRLSEDIPLVLIANKIDLVLARKVTTEEGKNLANQFGCPFFETSACERFCIDEPFYTLVREIRRKEVICFFKELASFTRTYSLPNKKVTTQEILNDQERRKVVAQVLKSYILVEEVVGGEYVQFSLWYFDDVEISIKYAQINISYPNRIRNNINAHWAEYSPMIGFLRVAHVSHLLLISNG